MKTGTQLIQEERTRQQRKLRWTKAHDDQHDNEELPRAAACYILAGRGILQQDRHTNCPTLWPWHYSDYNPKERLENLIRAGALIAAEIDRLQRARKVK